jgi:hypothetical protein
MDESRPSRQTAVSSLEFEWNAALQRLPPVSDSPSQPAGYNLSSHHVDFEPMDLDIQRRKRQDIVLSSLDVAIEASNLAKEFCSITPAKPVFGSFSVILTMIRVGLPASSMLIDCRLTSTQDSMTNEADCVELGLACADVCTALNRGLNGKMLKDLSDSVNEAIKQLTM